LNYETGNYTHFAQLVAWRSYTRKIEDSFFFIGGTNLWLFLAKRYRGDDFAEHAMQ